MVALAVAATVTVTAAVTVTATDVGSHAFAFVLVLVAVVILLGLFRVSKGVRGLLRDVHCCRPPAHREHVVLQHLEVLGLYLLYFKNMIRCTTSENIRKRNQTEKKG